MGTHFAESPLSAAARDGGPLKSIHGKEESRPVMPMSPLRSLITAQWDELQILGFTAPYPPGSILEMSL
jgi:hypothetical protein